MLTQAKKVKQMIKADRLKDRSESVKKLHTTIKLNASKKSFKTKLGRPIDKMNSTICEGMMSHEKLSPRRKPKKKAMMETSDQHF